MTSSWQVDVSAATALTAYEVGEVLASSQIAGDADGIYPLSEPVTMRLRGTGDAATHLLMRHSAEIVGYAQVSHVSGAGAEAELFVHPSHRRRGLGRLLVGTAMRAATTAIKAAGGAGEAARGAGHERRFDLWAHGEHPSANALASSMGFSRSRVLHQLRRPLEHLPASNDLPPGLHLRPFRPGEDDQAWLELNARAFVDLPDQGSWTQADLTARLREPWFDADGFLLAARDDGTLAGFHWTKIHPGGSVDANRTTGTEPFTGAGPDTGSPDTTGTGTGHDAIGEVYVLGVDPAAHGGGLGKTLTMAGLHYLREKGMRHVMLYVDEANPGAVALYRKLGFMTWANHVLFSHQLV